MKIYKFISFFLSTPKNRKISELEHEVNVLKMKNGKIEDKYKIEIETLSNEISKREEKIFELKEQIALKSKKNQLMIDKLKDKAEMRG